MVLLQEDKMITDDVQKAEGVGDSSWGFQLKGYCNSVKISYSYLNGIKQYRKNYSHMTRRNDEQIGFGMGVATEKE